MLKNILALIVLAFGFCATSLQAQANTPVEPSTIIGKFDTSKDLLLAQFDSKTDVDDIHTIAAVATMLRHPRFAQVKYHAVAGAYGIQEGLYVPAPELFNAAFAEHWSNAHIAREQALQEVMVLVQNTLKNGGDIWIAEAGQSDFSAAMVREVQHILPTINTNTRIHLVQHSKWNQKSATPEDLAFVKQHTDYTKIADGNATGNGTPGLRNDDRTLWVRPLADKKVGHLWQLAKSIAEKYNGVEERYNNPAVEKGGIDFSDTAEMCWIFGYNNIVDVSGFFDVFVDK
ncbi:hypothetical protein AB6T38_03435 [Aliiglaciecola sp. SL4]|uniref:hypothetical protein n=1 Tax=Aliiglaciecola sp. SL4 TaxID=3239806 RepID=UPI00355C91C2